MSCVAAPALQVLLKPPPADAQRLYLASLGALGVDVGAHDVRFVEDNWESPVLGAWGLGWEVWLDGQEVTQFTYFQQAGGLPLRPPACEITYGLERILMALQGVSHFKDIEYSPGLSYGEVWMQNEVEQSAYALSVADVAGLRSRFAAASAEARQLVGARLPLPAHDALLRASHAFNLLDARGAVGVTERAELFATMRGAARDVARLWLDRRQELGFPLLAASDGAEDDAVESGGAAAGCADGALPSGEATFVLELGFEELPAAEAASGASQLAAALPTLLASLRLEHGGVVVRGTPRRLVATVSRLAPSTQPRADAVRGPPARAARAPDGAWSAAAAGFARKCGVSVDDLQLVDGYLTAHTLQPGQPAGEVLAAALPAMVAGMAWARTMRWGRGAGAGAGADAAALSKPDKPDEAAGFPRPLRWLVALHGPAALRLRVAGCASGRTTYGLRKPDGGSPHLPPGAARALAVATADGHAAVLRAAGIVADPGERRAMLEKEVASAASAVGGVALLDAGLLDEVTYLTEAPVIICGAFEQRFLDLPPEVLITVMRKHQRYFPVASSPAASPPVLLPFFVTAANGACDEGVVRSGNEAVLRARLEDASFFYAADCGKDPEWLRSRTESTVFEARLGSILAKSERCEQLVRTHLAAAMRLSLADAATAADAARLARFDLATQVVCEFTDLAGTMGRHYARLAGLPPATADAIYEASLPKASGGELPASPAGVCASAAERIDALVGLFAVGCGPTATADPFGLRRAAAGLADALAGSGVRLSLRAAAAASASLQPVPVASSVVEEVAVFVARRLEQLLVDRGVAGVEAVRAVLAEQGDDPAAAASAAAALAAEAAQRPERYAAALAALARPTRLVRSGAAAAAAASAGGGAPPSVDPSLFVVSQEGELFASLQSAEAAVAAAPAGGEVGALFAAAEALRAPLDAFFEHVFVMADEPALRANRLALARRVAALPSGIADLAQLPGF